MALFAPEAVGPALFLVASRLLLFVGLVVYALALYGACILRELEENSTRSFPNRKTHEA